MTHKRLPSALRKAAIVPDSRTQRAERIVDHFRPVGGEENHIAGCSFRALHDRAQHVGSPGI